MKAGENKCLKKNGLINYVKCHHEIKDTEDRVTITDGGNMLTIFELDKHYFNALWAKTGVVGAENK